MFSSAESVVRDIPVIRASIAWLGTNAWSRHSLTLLQYRAETSSAILGFGGLIYRKYISSKSFEVCFMTQKLVFELPIGRSKYSIIVKIVPDSQGLLFDQNGPIDAL